MKPGTLRSRLASGTLALGLLLLSTVSVAGGVAVTTLDGKTSTFADQIAPGHWTVVMMWTTYCGYCRKQFPLVSAFHDRHNGRDGQVLGVSLDGPAEIEAVRAYVERKPFTFPTVIAESDSIKRMFEAATGETFTGTPTYMVFNPERKLVAVESGLVAEQAFDNFMKSKP